MDLIFRYGDCCSKHCDGFSFGKAAEKFDWPEAPVAEWLAGSVQEVAWHILIESIQN